MINVAVSLNVGKQRRMGAQRPRLDYTPSNKKSLSLADANRVSIAYNPETKIILSKNIFPVFDISLRKCMFGVKTRPIFLVTKLILKKEKLNLSSHLEI